MSVAANIVFAAEEGGDSGNFLVTPNVGIMIWTLLAFGITLFVLWKLAFPAIGAALDKRQKAIEDAIDSSERTKAEASRQREELLERTRRDIEAETKRALDEIRKEVADLTVIATEKVTRKSLTPEDHRRLIEEALGEVDFSTLAKESRN